jgi:hypothetical protein
LKYLLASVRRQYTQNLTHTPTRPSYETQAIRSWLQKRNAVAFDYSDGARKTVEGLELETGKVQGLESFRGVHRT